MRNRAMSNADVSSLFYICLVLQTLASTVEGKELIKAQLAKEYGQPFEHVLKALDEKNPPSSFEVSAEEVDQALVFLKQAGRFEEELAGFKPGSDGKNITSIQLPVCETSSLMVASKASSVLTGRPESGYDGTMAARWSFLANSSFYCATSWVGP